MLLAFLPIAALFGFILALGNTNKDMGWRRATMRAAALWGGYLVFLTELLSFWKALTPLGLVIAWSLPLCAVIVFLVLRSRRGHVFSIPHPGWPVDLFSRCLLLGVLLILVVTAILAWKSPPQTWDTLNYHMPRVAHWAQDKAVRHFTTGIEPQNYMSPGAEFITLHFYVLSGSDQFATIVSWLSVLGSLIGVSSLGAQFGLDGKAQIFTVLFTATLPMGIVQSSSTMTDCVVAFWMVIVAIETIALAKKEDDRLSILILGLAVGLAILVKPTAYAFAFPFAVYVLVVLIKRKDLARLVRSTLLVFILVLLLNIGHLARNQARYGNPFATQDKFSWLITENFNLPIVISNTLRNASLHAGTPSPHVNKGIYLFVAKVHELIGVDIMDSRTTHSSRYKVFPPSTHEDLTSNPLHALLILVALIMLLLRRKTIPREVLISGLAISSSFILVSTMVQWMPFNGRLHQTFFVLAAPWTVFMFSAVFSPRVLKFVSVVLLAAAWPWLVSIPSRPIIFQEGKSFVNSVFKEPREELYYASAGHLKTPHREIASRIRESDCSQVGLVLPGKDAEYPIWMLLGAPGDAPRIEWVIDDPYYSAPSGDEFRPCAIILRPCAQDQGIYEGLPRVYEHKPTEFCLFIES